MQKITKVTRAASAIKVSTILLILCFSVSLHADEKLDELVKLLGYEAQLDAMLKDIRPDQSLLNDASVSGELKELLLNHEQEGMQLFNRYFSWEALYPDIKRVLLNMYTPEEINAAYEFAQTKHGGSFLEKYAQLGDTFGHTLRGIAKEYIKEYNVLSEKQDLELNALAKKLEAKHPPKVTDKNEKITLRDIVKFSVYRENGMMIGYKVRPGDNPDLFESSPFKPDDIVIAINDTEINAPERIRSVAEAMKSEAPIYFKVRRKGRIVDFMLDLADY